jgi:hypothetical protein
MWENMWQYEIGKVVFHEGEWGHIVGFAKNGPDETILRVKFSDDESIRLIHPANLKINAFGQCAFAHG